MNMGSLLMKTLCYFADRKSFSIFCELNPYGRSYLKELMQFYQKFGLEILEKIERDGEIIRCSMFRKPQFRYDIPKFFQRINT